MALQGAGKRSLRSRRHQPRLAAVVVVLSTLVPGVLAVISMVVAIKVTVAWLRAAASRHCKRNEPQQEAALEDIFFAGHECSESVDVCCTTMSTLKIRLRDPLRRPPRPALTRGRQGY
jgi:Flp pilus assembly protein TadB